VHWGFDDDLAKNKYLYDSTETPPNRHRSSQLNVSELQVVACVSPVRLFAPAAAATYSAGLALKA